MRNTMSTNSAMMRAMTTPMQAPSTLAMRNIMPTKGLKAIVVSDETGKVSRFRHYVDTAKPAAAAQAG